MYAFSLKGWKKRNKTAKKEDYLVILNLERLRLLALTPQPQNYWMHS